MKIGRRKKSEYAAEYVAKKNIEQAKDIEQTTDGVDCSDLLCEKESIGNATENTTNAVNENANVAVNEKTIGIKKENTVDAVNEGTADTVRGNTIGTVNKNTSDTLNEEPVDGSAVKKEGKKERRKGIKKAVSKKGVEYVEAGGYHSDVVVKEKMSLIRKLSAIWTLVSTAYAIVSTCLFVSRDWVSSTVSYVLIGILSAYILVFIGLIIFVVRNPKKGTRATKYYKTVLKIYKTLINIVFLILTAVSMAGMAATDMSAGKWFMFVMSFIVAFVQLGFKLAMLAFKIARRWVAKRFKVKIENYRDGKKKKNTMMDSITERQYKDKD
ncbi:MAG: hypothetical protein K2G31_02675 [Clostridia bacterium]|nr:hypothetical protein [Clostridia bacterium]